MNTVIVSVNLTVKSSSFIIIQKKKLPYWNQITKLTKQIVNFRFSYLQVEINNFRDAFERGDDPLADMTDASDINSVAGVFKLYLRELREPIFPIIYFDQFMELARKAIWFLF
jgi:hypothetical protein